MRVAVDNANDVTTYHSHSISCVNKYLIPEARGARAGHRTMRHATQYEGGGRTKRRKSAFERCGATPRHVNIVIPSLLPLGATCHTTTSRNVRTLWLLMLLPTRFFNFGTEWCNKTWRYRCRTTNKTARRHRRIIITSNTYYINSCILGNVYW